MRKVLVVVDMQKDFVDGALGTPEAVAIVDNVVEKIEQFDGEIIVTYDTHHENYMETQLRTMSTFTYAKNNPVANPAESFYSLRCEAYDKHNARSDELIANYKMLEAQYKALLVEQSSILICLRIQLVKQANISQQQ